MDSDQPSLVVPMTPHTIQALKKMREVNDTPSRNRRGNRSVNRESPRNNLRSLSRVLANASEALAPSSVAPNDAVSFLENVKGAEEQGDALAPSEQTSTFGVDEEAARDETSKRLYSEPLNLPLRPEATESREQSVEIARRSARQRKMRRSSEGSIGISRMDSRFIYMHDTPSVTLMEEIQSKEISVLESGDRSCLDRNGSFVDICSQQQKTPRRDTMSDNNPGSGSDVEIGSTFAIEILSSQPKSPAMLMEKPIEINGFNIPGSSHGEVSSHENGFVPIPAVIVKRVASRFSKRPNKFKTRLGRESIAAIIQASNQFFEQLGPDLSAFAQHASRNNIDESDIIVVMKRLVNRTQIRQKSKAQRSH